MAGGKNSFLRKSISINKNKPTLRDKWAENERNAAQNRKTFDQIQEAWNAGEKDLPKRKKKVSNY